MIADRDKNFRLGANMAIVLGGYDGAPIERMVAAEEVLSSRDAEPVHRELCKIAAAAFEADGAGGTAPAILFRKLATAGVWHSEFSRFTDCVVRAMSKQAAQILPIIAGLHDKGGGGVVKNTIGLGMLGGTSLGSLAFLMARNSRQMSASNAELLEKVRAYKELRRDIEEDMAAKGILSGEEELDA
jgi:hypothetical protein